MRMKYIKRDFARRLRRGQTVTEEKIWQLLRNNQFMSLKFRRQHVVEGFVVDFYCHEHKLAVEVDGGVHEKKMRRDYDKIRQVELESEGITFIRITNQEIERDENILFNRIKEALKPQP